MIGQESLVQSGLSDGAVIVASLGDGARFGEIFDRHFAEIDRYLARRVGWVLADEIASEPHSALPGRAPVVNNGSAAGATGSK